MHRRQGMTLIEVLLAMAILGVGLAVLIEAAARCLAVTRRAQNFETARHLLYRLELEHPLGRDQEVEEGSEQGQFERPWDNYHWEREVTRAGNKKEEPFYQVRTRIAWSDAGRASAEEVLTYLFLPEQIKGGTFATPR